MELPMQGQSDIPDPATAAPRRAAVPRNPAAWKAWSPVAIVVVIGLAVTAIAYLTASRAEESRVIKGLEFRADWRASDLRGKIAFARGPLAATAIRASAEADMDVAEFYQFTSRVVAGRSSIGRPIVSIAWAEPVTRAQRAGFEAAHGFPILENGGDGSRVVAAERDDYTPILLQNRFDDKPRYLGFDLSGEPNRRRALEAARDSGEPKSVVSRLAFDPAHPTYVTYWPIFDTEQAPADLAARRQHLRGYVVAVFSVIDVLKGAIADTPDIPETINFYLSNDVEDEASERSFQLVATYAPAERAVQAAQAPVALPVAKYSFSRSFDVRGQKWRTDTFFSADAVARERSIGPRAILFAGLLLTAMLTAYVVGGIRRVSVVRILVDQRTAELTQTNTKLEALIDASPYAIICLDPEERVILWNATAEQLFGYAAGEVIGRPYPLVLPEEREEFAQRFRRLAAGEVLRNLASRRRHRDGSAIDTSSSAAAFYDADGTLLGIIFAIEDTRERNLVQNQLRQAQKMEAIGQLTGGLAHDFNNLIGIVLGNLDLLAERFEAGTEEREFTDPAIQAAERGAELTRQLLAFSRRQPLAPKLTYLPPVLEATAQLLRRTLGEAITLELKVSDTLWPVLIDVSQLESALLNLSVNARDAMRDGGRLTVEATNVVIDEDAGDVVQDAVAGEYVRIAVSDTGCGMSAEVLTHVFEPFFTTKGDGGTGLGLSMVHGFLKQSGGHTKIYSEPGHGTTIRLYLPRGREGAVSEIEARSTETLPCGHEVILVVEDNRGVRDLALRYLQSLGYRTIPAVDGVSALDIIKGGAPIDLLFTDVVMPGGMDGRALADAARRQRPGLRVLFTSGFTAAAASAVTENQFGSNLLSKPYRKDELARRVRAVLDAAAS
jgi:PAS domain S-box-containing protein